MIRKSTQKLVFLVALSSSLTAASPASAGARPMWLGIDEPSIVSASDSLDPLKNTALALTTRVKSAGVRFERVALSWREIAPRKPRNARDWQDPAYRWGYADAALRSVADTRVNIGAGLEPIVTIESAPDWAQMSNRPRTVELSRYPGAWKPNVAAVRDFAVALATRYSGGRKNIRGRLLPLVRRFQFWNEPNLSTHLSPQYDSKRKPFAALWYGRMLNAFRAGARQGGGSGVFVISAGLAPFGNVSGATSGTAPQAFARSLLCLNRTKRGLAPIRGCQPATFDAWAAHPYDIAGSPSRKADRQGQTGVVADLPAIRRMLDRAVALRTVRPTTSKPLWVTEFDWWTNPPARLLGANPQKAAEWTVQSLWQIWNSGVDVLIWYRLRDHVQWPGGLWYSGSNAIPSRLTPALLNRDSPKPSLARFKWPMLFVNAKRPYAWGIVPCRRASVTVSVERLDQAVWKPAGTGTTSAGGVLAVGVRAGAKTAWRALAPDSCGGSSPTWQA